MAGGLDAKVVLITGASSGIGEAAVRLVAKQDGLPVLSARHAPTDWRHVEKYPLSALAAEEYPTRCRAHWLLTQRRYFPTAER